MTPLPAPVAAVVAQWPEAAQRRFHAIRNIIHDTAAADADTGPLTETLKWGEPSWLTPTGTTLRCAWKSKRPEEIALFVICTSDMAATVRDIYPDAFDYEGVRGFWMQLDHDLPAQAVAHVASLAQRYKLPR